MRSQIMAVSALVGVLWSIGLQGSPTVTQFVSAEALFSSATSSHTFSMLSFDTDGLVTGQQVTTEYPEVSFLGLYAYNSNIFTRSKPFALNHLANSGFSLVFADPVASVGMFIGDLESAMTARVFTTSGFEDFSIPALGSADGFQFLGYASNANLITRIDFSGESGGGFALVDDLRWGRVTGLLTAVDIDIKPGSATNAINLNSAGTVPVAILSSPTFDATTVDPSSVTMAGASVKLIGKGDRYSCAGDDIDADALPDLVCHVTTAQFLIEPGQSIAVLEARTFSGARIRGEDSITIVQP